MKMIALVAALFISASAHSLSPALSIAEGRKKCCRDLTLDCMTCRLGSKKAACEGFPDLKGCATAGRSGTCGCREEQILAHPGRRKTFWCKSHVNGHIYRKKHCTGCETEACCARGGTWWLPKNLCKFQPDAAPTSKPTEKPKTPAPVTPPTSKPTPKPTQKPEPKGSCGCIAERFANLGQGTKAYCKNANGHIYHKHDCTRCDTESCCKKALGWLPKKTCKFTPERTGTCGCVAERIANLGKGRKAYCKNANGHIYHKHHCTDCTTAACCKTGDNTPWLPKNTCKFQPGILSAHGMPWGRRMEEESLVASLDLFDEDFTNVTESDSGRRMEEASLHLFDQDFTNVTVGLQ